MPRVGPLTPVFDRKIKRGSIQVGTTPSGFTFTHGEDIYSYTGMLDTWTVPTGIVIIEVELNAAQGGSITSGAQPLKDGGLGQHITSQHFVTPGDTINIYVGGQPTGVVGGFNGGADSRGGASSAGKGGGGASDIRLNGTALTDRLVVVGAGGGAGAGHPNSRVNAAGGNGGTNGTDGENGSTATNGRGRGATPSAGGTGGTGDNTWGPTDDEGVAGTLGDGGISGLYHGGGGGGGLYGGGGAGGGLGPGGGGGGSGGVLSGTLITSIDAIRTGHGEITIRW